MTESILRRLNFFEIEHLVYEARTLQNPQSTRVRHVLVSDTLETLLHACPHYIGREKNIYLFKKVSFDFKYVFKDFDSCYLC